MGALSKVRPHSCSLPDVYDHLILSVMSVEASGLQHTSTLICKLCIVDGRYFYLGILVGFLGFDLNSQLFSVNTTSWVQCIFSDQLHCSLCVTHSVELICSK